MKKLFLASFTILIAISVLGQATEVSIAGSQLKKITSSIVKGQEYVLHISLPTGYANSNKKYPVVYLMDSQWDFPLVTALYGEQYFDGFIPALIIVGITWGGDHPNPDSFRVRDYTPTRVAQSPQSGGADQFLSFIEKEVFPFIENNYKANAADRTLVGCSLGGLFTMYTLFTHPGMFNRYVAASPAFGWDNNVLYQYEKNYFANIANTPARLFMCIGGVETSAPDFEKLTAFLNDRQYKALQIESRVLENTGHSGTKGEGYARGLQYAFKRPDLKLSQQVLDQYKGTYKLSNGATVDVRSDNGLLAGYIGDTKYELHAASETDFYMISSFLNIHFQKDDKGNVAGFQLNTFGSGDFVNKIK